jgi:hypothetical protein
MQRDNCIFTVEKWVANMVNGLIGSGEDPFVGFCDFSDEPPSYIRSRNICIRSSKNILYQREIALVKDSEDNRSVSIRNYSQFRRFSTRL